MPVAKTDVEIQTEVVALEALKPKVRKFSAFGGDNHAAIQAQIEVLQSSMTADAIDRKWGDEDDLRNAAEHAADWANGDEADSPSDGWQVLAS